MKLKSVGVLAVGAAIGYAFGTENGRKKVAELKESGNRFLSRPDVQARTADLADKAKERTGSLPPQVQDIANSTIDAAQRRAGHGGPDDPAGGSESPDTGAPGTDPGDGTAPGASGEPSR